jgi:hypothetical protein
LGDAVHVADARLTFGTTLLNPITCLAGDFDGDGAFTVNDAALVAEAQFNQASLPWELYASHTLFLASLPFFARRQLSSLESKGVEPGKDGSPMVLLISMQKGAAERQVKVYVESADRTEVVWKALSFQFLSSSQISSQISTVQIHQGAPGQITAQHAGSFFQAAELGGTGAAWPTGLVATVTFEAGTDIKSLRIDTASFNTYVVLQVDPRCHVTKGVRCATLLPKLKIGVLQPVKDAPMPCAYTGWLKVLKC